MTDEHEREQDAAAEGPPSDDQRPGEPRPAEPMRDDATADEFETAPAGVHSEPIGRDEPGAGDAEPVPVPADLDTPAEPNPPREPEARPAVDAVSEVPPTTTPAATEWPVAPGIGGEQPPRAPAADVPAPPSEAEAYLAAPAASSVSPGAPATAAHSVPATPVGESTLCPRCGTENRPGIAFCRSCGQRLQAAGIPTAVARPGAPEGTQSCPRCGTHNRAGVAFCQNCGANLRAAGPTSPDVATPGAPVAPGGPASSVTQPVTATRAPAGGAVLGPIVLLIGALGIATAWLLPFAFGSDSLWARSFGAPGGYGIGFWNGYASVGGGVADHAYFGFAAPAPILVLLIAVLSIAGFLRAAPGRLQRWGLAIALVWSIGLAVLFVVVEVGGAWGGDLVAVARTLTPGGIIFLLASLIVLLGALTRFARS
jgi:Double zinc ribbon